MLRHYARFIFRQILPRQLPSPLIYLIFRYALLRHELMPPHASELRHYADADAMP